MFDADIVGDNIIAFFYNVFVKICKVNLENIKNLVFIRNLVFMLI